MRNNLNKKSGGYTIIETLVAITILMIAIAGPLTVANKALTAALDARSQLIASSLAQEGMEFLKNLKDNNVALYGQDSWLNDPSHPQMSITPCAGPESDISKICAVSGIISPAGNPYTQGATDYCSASGYGGCLLYIDDTIGYTYGSGGSRRQSPYTRYYFLTQGATANERIATVVVSWDTGPINKQVRLESLLTNGIR